MVYGFCSDVYEGNRCEHEALVLVLDIATEEETGAESIEASHFLCPFHATLRIVNLYGVHMRVRNLFPNR